MILAVGNLNEADGLFLNAANLAQIHWCNKDGSKNLIPFAELESIDKFDLLIKCGLIDKKPGGYYMRGSEEHFAWYHVRIENGKKGGRPKSTSHEVNNLQDTDRVPIGGLTEPSSSSSSSSSFSKKKNNKNSSPSASDALIENLYAAYPNKVGKKRGVEKLRKEIGAPKDGADFLAAVENYKAYVEQQRSGTFPDLQWKHFSTFVNEWRDWIESKGGTCSKGKIADMLKKGYLEQSKKG